MRQSTAEPQAEPNEPRQNCKEGHEGDEVSCDKVRYSFDRSFSCLSIPDHVNDLVKPRREAV